MKKIQGYFINAECTAIVSMHKVLPHGITEKTSNFFESEDLGDYIDIIRDNEGKIVALKKGKPYVPSTAELQAQELQAEVTTQ
ncbi:MAG: hypothetical protein ACRC3G_01970, partial [Bacteroidales bacterium]